MSNKKKTNSTKKVTKKLPVVIKSKVEKFERGGEIKKK